MSATTQGPMLELSDIHVHLSGRPVLRGISLAVAPGHVVGLVGRNGAGKTTTLRTAMGLVPAGAGHIRLDGHDLLRAPAHARARLGVGYMPEDRRLIGPMTVAENILLPLWATGARYDGTLDRVYRLMPEVRDLADRRAGLLSGGQQKMVALARALATGTRLLLLDEPFEGLAPGLVSRLSDVIRALRQGSLGILICESDPRALHNLADVVYTIERGEILSVHEVA